MLKQQLLDKLVHVFGLSQSLDSLSLDDFYACDDNTVQLTLAPILRHRVVQFLNEDMHPIAQSFRAESIIRYGMSYETYLLQQSQNGAWGTYLEAAVLAHLLGVRLEVRHYTSETAYEIIPIDTAIGPEAPTLVLFNHSNVHWFIDRETLPDGNCLYNAVAQWLRAVTHNLAQEDEEMALLEYCTGLAELELSSPEDFELVARSESRLGHRAVRSAEPLFMGQEEPSGIVRKRALSTADTDAHEYPLMFNQYPGLFFKSLTELPTRQLNVSPSEGAGAASSGSDEYGGRGKRQRLRTVEIYNEAELELYCQGLDPAMETSPK